MKLITQRVFVILCSLLFTYNIGVESSIVLSEEEEFSLEKQLKLINKPALEIIKTIYGDTYACVDFYKQPAFDHPSMRNYMYKMNSSSYYPSSKVNNRFGEIWANGKGCPIGTVPVRRVTKDELVKVNEFTKTYASSQHLNTNHTANHNELHHFAVASTIKSSKRAFNGAGMKSSVYNYKIDSSTFSACRMVVSKARVEQIQVGWIIFPIHYGDTITRMFIYTKIGQLMCYNTFCPGFVLVHPQVPVDMPLEPISTIGGQTHHIKFYMYRDESVNKGWWLRFKDEDTPVGYWPYEILNELKNMADYIEWGGQTYAPRGVFSPPMGSGQNLVEKNVSTKTDAYVANLFTTNEKHEVDYNPNYIAKYISDSPKNLVRYNVVDVGEHENYGGVHENYGRLVYYGGQGGYKP